MSAQPSPLSALSEIISTGLKTIEETYAKHGVPYPSLDEPFRPDTVQDPAVMASAAAVIAAASQVIATIQMPAFYLIENTLAVRALLASASRTV